mgnify:CR=1 FL=1
MTPKSLLLPVFLFVAIVGHTQIITETADFKASTIDDCFENAARKIVDNYSYRDPGVHEVVDIDIIHHQLTDNSADVSVQWSANVGGVTRIYWVKGIVRYRGSACCGAYFELVDYARVIDPTKVMQNLNCTDDFIQKSLGTGKPFRPRKRSHH